MSHAPSGVSVEDAFIEAIEYDVGATSVRIQLSRCFDESGRELALTLEFERVVHVASYCEPTFSAAQSLAIALLTVPIPPKLADRRRSSAPGSSLIRTSVLQAQGHSPSLIGLPVASCIASSSKRWDSNSLSFAMSSVAQ